MITKVTASLAVTLIAVAIAGGSTRNAGAGIVTVPNVIGMRALAAEQMLESAGLRWRFDDGPPPSPANHFFLLDRIYGQTFAGQQVKPGTTILLSPESRKIVVLTALPYAR